MTSGLTALALVVALALIAASSCSASAPSVRLKIALTPERLGADTTIEFGLEISGPHGATPPPARTIALYYPSQLGILDTGLGSAECSASMLEALGEKGCPSQSLMGYGTATAAVQVGDQQVLEHAVSSVYMAPFQNGSVALNFFVDAKSPLIDEVIFTGLIQRARPPYGGQLILNLPVLESWPAGPDAALVDLHSTIGPLGITYYDHSHGRFVPYRPRGMRLPNRCPRGGFPFQASLDFFDGSHVLARAAVPCPHPSPKISSRVG